MTISIAKGITITPPVVGCVKMGHTVIKGDRGLPVRDDHFSITTLIQDKATRVWETHPIQKAVCAASKLGPKDKLRAIPVRIAYNDKGLSLHNHFSAFDPKKGRVLCVGNGVTAKRATEDGVKEIACPKSEACEYGVRNRCKNMSRAYFRIEGQEDELGLFMLRTTSRNSLNYLFTALTQLHGLTGGRMAGMPLMMYMETKTTTQSFGEPVHFARLEVRPGMTLIDAFKEARAYQDMMAQAGLSIDAMEADLAAGYAHSEFSDEIEDIDEWISDEDLVARVQSETGAPRGGMKGLDNLTEKLGILQARATEPGAPPAVVEEAPAANVTA